ncbi:hypothetical protein HHI36_011808 [Cryptolaemus montrouzieri]|uniref:MADF domain-containing protein n=1 Tax=Cryptolaemus montrouzieri TaxID=559131 RepID=A0ABD2NCF2_9CUCU
MPYDNQSNIDDYKLIGLVEHRPAIWSPGHTSYGNIGLRNKMWAEIGMALKVDPTICRNRWVNIRDNFRRSLKKNRDEFGQKTYKFYNELGFLKAVILDGPKSNNLNEIKDHTSSPIVIKVNKLEREGSSTTFKKRIISECSESSENSTEKRICNTESNVESKMVPSNTNVDAVDAFLAGLAPTLKSLSPYYLNLAKSKIFMTVQKFEMNMLLESQNQDISYQNNIHVENEDSDIELPASPLDIDDMLIDQKPRNLNT